MAHPTDSRTSSKAAVKPKKPYSSFPLSPHPSGKWQKKIRGRIHYFGNWGRQVNGKLERVENDGWESALKLYESQAPYLHAGLVLPAESDGLTLMELCNKFLQSKERRVESGELGIRMFADYKEAKDLLISTFGKTRPVHSLTATDFGRLRNAMAKKWGPVRLGNAITRVKSFFKYGTENNLIEKAVRYGSEFRKPDRSVLRRHRADTPKKIIEPADLSEIVKAADPALAAMIHLGLNCAFGNSDCAVLPLAALNLETGWVDFPRPKTGVERRCPLWPETVGAIRSALAVRPKPASGTDAGLAFLSSRGTGMVRPIGDSHVDLVTIGFTKLLKSLKLHRRGVGFYTLRHCFRTVADAVRDPVAINLIMGHTDTSMAAHYRERIENEDARLMAVTNYVRSWLLGIPSEEF